ncbi:MAG TPA: APC family permease [Myxococcota bacterium]
MLRRGIKPLALFATMFVVFCGGPFGMEEIVPLAGPGLFALVLVVVPIIWAIPSALIVAELVSAIPVQGGPYQWYRASLSPFWSFQIAYLDWLAWALDSALYPPLLAGYLILGLLDHPIPGLRELVCMAVIWGCAWINIRGVKEVGQVSMIMTAVILIPVTVMVVLSVPKLSFAAMGPFVPEGQSVWTAINYAVIWAIWSYSGYSGLATASEEIETPERTYPKMLAIFLPISVLAYVMPLFAGVAGDPSWQAWGPAHLSVAAAALGGTLLAASIATAGQVATLGLYNGEQMILARFTYAMSRDGLLPPSLSRLHPRHGTPAVALIFHAVLFSALVLVFDFVELLVLGALVSVPAYIFTFLAPVILRYRYPNLRGPFRIPGGWPVLIPMVFVPSCVALYLLATAQAKSLIIAGCFAVAGPVIYLVARWYNLRLGIDTNAPNPIEQLQAIARRDVDESGDR